MILPSNTLGQVSGNILTLGELIVASSQLSTFFGESADTLTPLGSAGSAAKYSCTSGKTYQIDYVAKKVPALVFFNGDEGSIVEAQAGKGQIIFTASSTSWGLALIQEFATTGVSLEVTGIQEISIPSQTQIVSFSGAGASANLMAETYNIETLGLDIISLGRNLKCPELAALGLRGSAVNISGLQTGVYSFDLDIPVVDPVNADELYAFNGYELTKIADVNGKVLGATIENLYGQVSLIAVEKVIKEGKTRFVVSGLTRTGNLASPAPTKVSLVPNLTVGAVKMQDYSVNINNAAGSVAVALIESHAGLPSITAALPGATEGSYAQWSVANGTYDISYSLSTSEKTTSQDAFLFYNGTAWAPLETRNTASTVKIADKTWVSSRITKTVTVTNGKLGILCADTVTKLGNTFMYIDAIRVA